MDCMYGYNESRLTEEKKQIISFLKENGVLEIKHLECVTSGSDKFYTLFRTKTKTVSSYGPRPRGGAGDLRVEALQPYWDEALLCRKDMEGMTGEKVRKGYQLLLHITRDEDTVVVKHGASILKLTDTKAERISSGDVDPKSLKGADFETHKWAGKVKSMEETAKAEEKVMPKTPEKPAEKEIILTKCKETKENVPSMAEAWFKDTGYVKIVALGVRDNLPVLLKGDTGCGKTSLIRYLAAVTANGFRRLNLNGSTTVDEFVGKWVIKDGTMVWVDGILTDCMRKGHWLLCDEVNAALPEVMFAMHSLLDDDRMVVLSSKDNEIVKPHKDFRFFASMNPDYAGTHQLNFAFEDRFPIVVNMAYPEEDMELEIIQKRSGNADQGLMRKMIKVADRAREALAEEKLLTPFSTRKLIDWARLSRAFGPAKAFTFAVLNKSSKEDKVVLRDIVGTIFSDVEFRNELQVV